MHYAHQKVCVTRGRHQSAALTSCSSVFLNPHAPNWADYTDTQSASSAASQLFVYPCNHSLASIFGTPVIFYIYPLRFLSRLIIVLHADILTHRWHPLCSLPLQPQRNVFGYWSMTKIIILFFNTGCSGTTAGERCRAPLQCVCMFVVQVWLRL